MRGVLALFVVLLGLFAAPRAAVGQMQLAPSASASVTRAAVEGVVRLKDRRVFAVSADRPSKSAVERARAASRALEAAFDAHETDARWEWNGGVAIVYVGTTPIVELDEEDSRAAGAVTVEAHAADVTAKVRAAISQESKRSALANQVFSVSLVVFSGLIAFLLLGRTAHLSARGRAWLQANPHRIRPLRFAEVEVLRAAAVEAFLVLGLEVLKRVIQFGVLYGWLLFALSLFTATKGYTDRLTALVLSPMSGFFTRLGTALPLAVVAAIAVLAVVILVRAVGVFFGGVTRGETTIDWIPREFAAAVGVLVRIAVVVVALMFAAPLLTGSDEGNLSRLGFATVAALALAATPVLACGTVGMIVIFGRRFRVGDFVEFGPRRGRVRGVTLLEVTIEDQHGCEIRVPHLLSLQQAIRVMGASALLSIELVVDPGVPQQRVRATLTEAAAKAGSSVTVELVSIDADGAFYTVTVRVSATRGAAAPSSAEFTTLLTDALARESIALGRRASPRSAA